MYVTLVFWLGLALPGYALVRRVGQDNRASGLLGMLGLSYLGALTLLSPISILCYLLHAPVAVFSGACVLAVVAAVIEITRKRWWRDLGRMCVGAISVELLIVVADLILGARTGALTGGDAPLHLARIRSLLDHGFQNYDPFVAGGYFFPIYHTNILHALYAACSQLTAVPHVTVWFMSLVWAKLLIASGIYSMTWSVFGRRWPAWVATVFVVGCQGSVTFVVYPNKLAPYWLVPLMIGVAVEACRRRGTWVSVLKLAAGSLVLGQVHALYGAFAGVVLGPVLAVVGLGRFLRRRQDRWRLAACTLALTAALPFLMVSKITLKPASRPQAGAQVRSQTGKRGPFERLDHGWVMMKPRFGWGIPRNRRSGLLTVVLLGGIACAVIGPRRKPALLFLAVVGTAGLILYLPPLCTATLRVFQREWILARMGFVLYLGFIGLVPASVACLIEPTSRFRWPVRSAFSVLALLLAAVTFLPHRPPYDWQTYYAKACQSAQQRHAFLTTTRRIVQFCRQHIEPGSTVLLEAFPGMVLTSIHDCFIVAPLRGSNGVADWGQRRRDLKTMLAADTPWPTRRALLRRYDVEYFFPARSPTAWTKGHVKRAYRLAKSRLFVLDPEILRK